MQHYITSGQNFSVLTSATVNICIMSLCVLILHCQTGAVLYKVRWRGYTEADDTWEPEENLTGCQGLVAKFIRKREKVL